MKKVLGLILAASVALAAPLAHAKEPVPAAKRIEQPAPVSVTLSAWSVTLDKARRPSSAPNPPSPATSSNTAPSCATSPAPR